MNKPRDFSVDAIDQDDIGNNNSTNETFNSVLNARLSRRNLMRGGIASAAGAFFGSVGLTACGGSSDAGTPPVQATATETLLGYTAVPKSLADAVVVPVG